MYLGDGYIATHSRTYRLRIFLNRNQPRIISECTRAINALAQPRKVSLIERRDNCIEVAGYWQAWPLVFPQHGPGKKHSRKIELTDQQWEIVRKFPDAFVRGCIQSDGCKHRRVVRGKDYPAYSFSNRAEDIIDLFCRACDLLSIRHTRAHTTTVSVARRDAVALMDRIVGGEDSLGSDRTPGHYTWAGWAWPAPSRASWVPDTGPHERLELAEIDDVPRFAIGTGDEEPFSKAPADHERITSERNQGL
jgi:hypothetical protein